MEKDIVTKAAKTAREMGVEARVVRRVYQQDYVAIYAEDNKSGWEIGKKLREIYAPEYIHFIVFNKTKG